MKYQVYLVDAAKLDLLELHLYVELNDSQERADQLLDKIEQTIASLDRLPERGHFPPELEWIGVHAYREIHYKPYRIIYEVSSRTVIVHGIFDGRRDLRDLLQSRTLR